MADAEPALNGMYGLRDTLVPVERSPAPGCVSKLIAVSREQQLSLFPLTQLAELPRRAPMSGIKFPPVYGRVFVANAQPARRIEFRYH